MGVDKLVDASLLPPASRQRSMQLGPIREDQRVYHTGGTARVGSMPLPSLGTPPPPGSSLTSASPSREGPNRDLLRHSLYHTVGTARVSSMPLPSLSEPPPPPPLPPTPSPTPRAACL